MRPTCVLSTFGSVFMGTTMTALAIGARPAAATLPRQSLDSPAESFTGTLVAVDALSLAVRADDGVLVAFKVDHPGAVPAGLVAGTHVMVRYRTLETGERRVVRIAIASRPRDPGSTTEPPTELVRAPAPVAADPAAAPARKSLPAPAPAPDPQVHRPPPPIPGSLELVLFVLLVVAAGGLLFLTARRP